RGRFAMTATNRWEYEVSSSGAWAAYEELRIDARLTAAVGVGGAHGLAVVVRELLSNAHHHGTSMDGVAEVTFCRVAGRFLLRIPGAPFASTVPPGSQRARGFLNTFQKLSAEDGVTWSWWYDGGANHIEAD